MTDGALPLKSRFEKATKRRRVSGMQKFGATASALVLMVFGHHAMRMDQSPDVDVSLMHTAQQVFGSDVVMDNDVQALQSLQDAHWLQPNLISAHYDMLANHVIWKCGFWDIRNCAPEIRAQTAALYTAYSPSAAYVEWRDARHSQLIERIEGDAYITQARLAWNELNNDARAPVMQRIVAIHHEVYGADGFIGTPPPLNVGPIGGSTLARMEMMRVPFMRNSSILMDEATLFEADFSTALSHVLHELEHVVQLYMGDIRLLAQGRDYLNHYGIYDDAVIYGHAFETLRLPPEQCVAGNLVPSPYYWNSPIEQGARQASHWAGRLKPVFVEPRVFDAEAQAFNAQDFAVIAPVASDARVAPAPKPKAPC